MTPEQAAAMTDDELNRFLAEKVMGWHEEICRDKHGRDYLVWWEDIRLGGSALRIELWNPATSLDDAWRAAVKSGDTDFEIRSFGVTIFPPDTKPPPYHEIPVRINKDVGPARCLSEALAIATLEE